MKKLKDQLNEGLQSLLPLNFLLAEFQASNDDSSVSGEIPDLESVKLKYEISTVHTNRMFGSYLFHRHISRTFDIGECKKTE